MQHSRNVEILPPSRYFVQSNWKTGTILTLQKTRGEPKKIAFILFGWLAIGRTDMFPVPFTKKSGAWNEFVSERVYKSLNLHQHV